MKRLPLFGRLNAILNSDHLTVGLQVKELVGIQFLNFRDFFLTRWGTIDKMDVTETLIHNLIPFHLLDIWVTVLNDWDLFSFYFNIEFLHILVVTVCLQMIFIIEESARNYFPLQVFILKYEIEGHDELFLSVLISDETTFFFYGWLDWMLSSWSWLWIFWSFWA